MNILKIISISLTAALLTSCSDFLNEYSQDRVVAKTVYHFDEVLLGSVYLKSYAITSGPSGRNTAGFFNILDDDVNTGSVGVETPKTWSDCLGGIFGYFAWQLRVGSNYNYSYFQPDNATWNDLYARINVCNIILDEIVDMPHTLDKDAAAFLRVQGETHFCRAYFYFTLANLYGDAYAPSTAADKLCVPLKLTPYVEHDRDKNTQFTRATVKEVYDQIVSDLTLAEQYLQESPQHNDHRLHRASYESVELLFSRVLLYMQNWEGAEEKAENLLKSPHARLSGLAQLESGPFLTESNPEILFSQGANNLSRENLFTGQPGDFCVTRQLRDLYSENDLRASCFFGAHVSDSVTLTAKYQRTSLQLHISDVFTLRTAEAYLNKAEACAMQPGKESEACEALNTIRRNRITDAIDLHLDGEALVNEIRDERRRELCFEGHRWFDLRRYAVNERYPYSKSIVHAYHACGDFGVSSSKYYLLEENDPAYTFALPEDVIKFDRVPMPDNYRENRDPMTVAVPEE